MAGGNLYAARLPGETHGTSNRNHHGFSRGGGGVTPEVTPAQPRVAGGRDVTVEIAAENMAFNAGTITVPAGARVAIIFENRDEGVPHNVSVYTDSSATTPIYVGEIVTGPARAAYAFTAPGTSGTYFFRCDVHPSMNGDFIVE